MGRVSVVGMATRHGLHAPGISCSFVAEYVKTRCQCSSELKQIGSNTGVDILCADASGRELRVRIPPGALMSVLCVVSKDKKAKCRTIKTKKQVRMKYEQNKKEYKKSWWGRDFPSLSRPALGPIQLPIEWVPGLFPRGKAAWAWRQPVTPSSAEVKERVELYLCSPCGPSWPVVGRT